MKFAKRITALCLTLALCVSPALAAGVEDKFPAIKEYPGYADVPAGIWYEENAKLCYEVGLITGSAVGFEPGRNMTMGEVAAISARILEAVTGETIPMPTPNPNLPWYQHYLDYLTAHGITGLEKPEATATRGEFIALLSAALPDELLTPVNAVTALPDSSAPAVLKFYNAGILTGTDKYGTFAAQNSLTRQEGAAMVSRVVRESLRKSFVPADYTPFTAAGVKPGDLFFAGGVTAERYLDTALAHIAALEASCKTQGIEFNWFNTVGDKSFLDYVKETTLSDLGIDKKAGTDLFTNFDLQVFYSRYIDLKGLTA